MANNMPGLLGMQPWRNPQPQTDFNAMARQLAGPMPELPQMPQQTPISGQMGGGFSMSELGPMGGGMPLSILPGPTGGSGGGMPGAVNNFGDFMNEFNMGQRQLQNIPGQNPFAWGDEDLIARLTQGY